jgi:RIO-like serine/threonine protein kinase
MCDVSIIIGIGKNSAIYASKIMKTAAIMKKHD